MTFPFIGIVTQGKQTEIVLARGPGLHTVMGMTIDIGIETVMHDIGNELTKYCRLVLEDQKQISQFIQDYNNDFKSNPAK